MWCVLMQWVGSENWYRGAARFSDKELAEEHARNEYQRHPTMKAWRVEPMPEEGMHPVAHNSGAEPPSVTSDVCTSRDLVVAGRLSCSLTVPTGAAVRIVLQVAALLVVGTWGALYVIASALWLLYWR